MLAIATNIPQRLKTGFVLQGHIWESNTVMVIDITFTTRLVQQIAYFPFYTIKWFKKFQQYIFACKA